MSAFATIPLYFQDRYRMIAIGFTSFGSGVGSIFFPVFLEILLREYTWSGVLLVTSGVVFNTCISAVICVQPSSRNQLNYEDERHVEQNLVTDDKDKNGSGISIFDKLLLLLTKKRVHNIWSNGHIDSAMF